MSLIAKFIYDRRSDKSGRPNPQTTNQIGQPEFVLTSQLSVINPLESPPYGPLALNIRQQMLSATGQVLAETLNTVEAVAIAPDEEMKFFFDAPSTRELTAIPLAGLSVTNLPFTFRGTVVDGDGTTILDQSVAMLLKGADVTFAGEPGPYQPPQADGDTNTAALKELVVKKGELAAAKIIAVKIPLLEAQIEVLEKLTS